MQNGQFLLIADRGIKLSPQSYTTGTIAAMYITESSFTCYRNGIFARPVNDFNTMFLKVSDVLFLKFM